MRLAVRTGVMFAAAWMLAACSTFEIHIETQVIINVGVTATTPAPAGTVAQPAETAVAAVSPTPTVTANAPPTQGAATATTTESPTPSATAPPASTATTAPTTAPSQTAAATPCTAAWFFQPPPTPCPVGPAETWTGAAQYFENGFMLWTSEPDKFWVFLSESQNFLAIAAPYSMRSGQQVTATPPPGRQAPVSGFDLVWRGAIVADNVNFDDLPTRLGWAIEAEHQWTGNFQCHTGLTRAEERCYLRDPSGQIIYLTPFGAWAYAFP